MEITLSFSSPVIPRLPFSSSSSSTLSFLAANSSSSSLLLRKGKTRTCRRTKGLTCNALFGLGLPELVVIAGVAALAFGPKNLPQVGRSIGKTLKNFQQAAKEFESELKKEPNSSEETLVQKPTATREQEEREIKDSV